MFRRLTNKQRLAARNFKGLKNNDGSITFEATNVFPIVLLITLSIFCFSITVYAYMRTYAASTLVAEQLSFTWNQSSSHPVTGEWDVINSDSLYWRTFDNGIFDLFDGSDAKLSLAIHPDQPITSNDKSLPIQKLERGLPLIPADLTGELTYINQVIVTYIELRLQQKVPIPSPVRRLLPDGLASSESRSLVVEPAEFIRTIDLIRHYVPAIKSRMTKAEARAAIDAFRNIGRGNRETLTFEHHDEALKYTQKLVGGRQSRFDTKDTGKWRMIDALDADGIAHQVYLGAKTANKEMLEQMEKDVELLRKGILNGVVWHYYKRTGNDRMGPSDKLLQQLQQNGIIVIIHDD